METKTEEIVGRLNEWIKRHWDYDCKCDSDVGFICELCFDLQLMIDCKMEIERLTKEER